MRRERRSARYQMRKMVLAIATAGGVGYAPFAPGTFGSLVGVGLWAGLAALGSAVSVVGGIALCGLAIWTSGRAQLSLGDDDGRIVIDEVAGQVIALLLLPLRLDVALAGFGLFRLLDIWKPLPVRKFEALPGGA